MPYAIKGNSVIKKTTGKVVGHSSNPKEYLKTLNAIDHGWKPTKKYKKLQHKLRVKTHKPGDLLSAYKKQVVTKGKWYAETDTHKKVIKVNKKMHKTHPLHKKQYPELADTIYHELHHAKHPEATEKETYKKTHKAIKTMGPKAKKKLYSLFQGK